MNTTMHARVIKMALCTSLMLAPQITAPKMNKTEKCLFTLAVGTSLGFIAYHLHDYWYTQKAEARNAYVPHTISAPMHTSAFYEPKAPILDSTMMFISQDRIIPHRSQTTERTMWLDIDDIKIVANWPTHILIVLKPGYERPMIDPHDPRITNFDYTDGTINRGTQKYNKCCSGLGGKNLFHLYGMASGYTYFLPGDHGHPFFNHHAHLLLEKKLVPRI